MGLLFTNASSTLQAQSREDLSRVKSQTVALIARAASPKTRETGWFQTLAPDGHWPDIDYTARDRSGWPAMDHLHRLAILGALYAQTKVEGHPDAALRETVTRAFDYWLDHTPQSDNWWYGSIGGPKELVDTMILLEDTLTPEEKARGLELSDRFDDKATGQNLVWYVSNQMKRALLMNDAALAGRRRGVILSELKETMAEGLQHDQSYHQHGPQLQFGNYGLAYLATIGDLAWTWRGTSFALDPEKLSVLRRFILEGMSALVANRTMDISSCGRQISPGAPLAKGSTVLRQLRTMIETDPEHAADYSTAIEQISAPERCGKAGLPDGRLDRVFYRSDYLVHRRPTFFASVKLCSRRVKGGENTNRENELGRYLADGCLFVYQDSREYTDIFPVWDWRKLPGVTCAASGETLLPEWNRETDFAGGVSDGVDGAAGLDYRRDGVKGRKSWFLLDDAIVCLGAGLSGSDPSELTTTVEQCWLKGGIFAGPAGGPGGAAPAGRHPAAAGTTWVWHNHRGYVLPGNQRFVFGGASQSGSWHRVMVSKGKTPVTGDVFTLWIDHGPKPANAGYVYIVLPAATAEQTAAWAAKPTVTVLSNTPGVQAIEETRRNRVMAVFFQPGRIDSRIGSLEADAPCAVILNGGGGEGKNGEDGSAPRLTVSDPSQLGTKVTIRYRGKPVTVVLPQAEEAGKSVSVDWGSPR